MDKWKIVKFLYWFDRVCTVLAWVGVAICVPGFASAAYQGEALVAVGFLALAFALVLVARWHPSLITIEDVKK